MTWKTVDPCTLCMGTLFCLDQPRPDVAADVTKVPLRPGLIVTLRRGDGAVSCRYRPDVRFPVYVAVFRPLLHGVKFLSLCVITLHSCIKVKRVSPVVNPAPVTAKEVADNPWISTVFSSSCCQSWQPQCRFIWCPSDQLQHRSSSRLVRTLYGHCCPCFLVCWI